MNKTNETASANSFWTKNRCAAKAKKATTKMEFKAKNPEAYAAAKANQWLREICSHMTLKRPAGFWTRQNCKSEAAKFNSRSEFAKGSSTAYLTAHKNGWLNALCKHMERPVRTRTTAKKNTAVKAMNTPTRKTGNR